MDSLSFWVSCALVAFRVSTVCSSSLRQVPRLSVVAAVRAKMTGQTQIPFAGQRDFPGAIDIVGAGAVIVRSILKKKVHVLGRQIGLRKGGDGDLVVRQEHDLAASELAQFLRRG